MAKDCIVISSILVLASFICLVGAGTCPTENEATPVDLDKLKGEWYMVSGTSITGQAGKCLHFDVDHVSENHFRMNFTTTSYRNNKRIWWNVEGNQNGTRLPATWQLFSSTRVIGPFEHQVLTVDYSSHAAIIVCAPDTKFIPKQFFAMIWSRQRTLADTVLGDLKERISQFIAREDIIDIDNTCSELD